MARCHSVPRGLELGALDLLGFSIGSFVAQEIALIRPAVFMGSAASRQAGVEILGRLTTQRDDRGMQSVRDRSLGPTPAEPHLDDVPNLDRERLPDASHWVHHDEPERVTQFLSDFFATTR